jgi:hypothetical protein
LYPETKGPTLEEIAYSETRLTILHSNMRLLTVETTVFDGKPVKAGKEGYDEEQEIRDEVPNSA